MGRGWRRVALAAGLALIGLAVPALWSVPAPIARPLADETLAALLPAHAWDYGALGFSWQPLRGEYRLDLGDLRVSDAEGAVLLRAGRAELRRALPLPGSEGTGDWLILEGLDAVAEPDPAGSGLGLRQAGHAAARAGGLTELLRALGAAGEVDPPRAIALRRSTLSLGDGAGHRSGAGSGAGSGVGAAIGALSVRIDELVLRPAGPAGGLGLSMQGGISHAEGEAGLSAEGRWHPGTGNLQLDLRLAELRPAILSGFEMLEVPLSGEMQVQLDHGTGLSLIAFDLEARSGTLELAELAGESIRVGRFAVAGSVRAMTGRTEIRLDSLQLETAQGHFEGLAAVDLLPGEIEVSLRVEGPLEHFADLAPRWLARLMHAAGPGAGRGRLAVHARFDRESGAWSGTGKLWSAAGEASGGAALPLAVTGSDDLPVIYPAR